MRRRTIYEILILLFALSLVMLTLSSCRLDIMTDIMDGYDSNPFLDRKPLDTARQGDDEITFLLFSDAHLNRKDEDSWAEDNTPYLKDFLCENGNDYDFVISLGDIEDAGDINAPELHEFLSFFKENCKASMSVQSGMSCMQATDFSGRSAAIRTEIFQYM